MLLASRFPLSLLPDVPDSVLWSQGNYAPDREKLRLHWTRRTLFALLYSPWGEIEVAYVYITPANHFEKDANGGRKLYPYLKLDLCAGVYQTLAIPTHRPRLLCGDLNAPQHERESGEIITWGYVNVPPVSNRRLLRRCQRWPRPDRELLVSQVQNNLR